MKDDGFTKQVNKRESGQQLSKSDVLRTEHLTSAARIVVTIKGFHDRYGCWPSKIVMAKSMADAIKSHVLTDLGWQLLKDKLQIHAIEEGTVYAENEKGDRFKYGDSGFQPTSQNRADFWIWGMNLMDS
jgi:hypothetical protein